MVYDAARSSADDAWQAAYKESLTAPLWQQTTELLELIGPRFTTAGVGLRDARTVRRWRDEQVEPRDHAEAQRLRLLYRLVKTITGVYAGGSVAAGWLRSANPQLDDEAPLVLLATHDPDEVQQQLLGAVRSFLEG